MTEEELNKAFDDIVQKSKEETPLNTEENIETSEHQEEKQHTDFEKEQIAQGWDPNGEKSAKEYAHDGSFFKKIASQKKEINELKTAFREMTSHLKKSEQAAYQKALLDIRTQRNAAIEIGDVRQANALDDKAEAIKDSLRKTAEETHQFQEEVQEHHPEALKFKERHANWFGKYETGKDATSLSDIEKENLEMTETATVYDDYLGRMVKEGRVNYTPEQAIKMVEERIKKYYPHRFENPKKSEPPAVAKASQGTGTLSEGKLAGRLTARQQDIYAMYKKIDPKFGSLEDYAKRLQQIGDLKHE